MLYNGGVAVNTDTRWMALSGSIEQAQSQRPAHAPYHSIKPPFEMLKTKPEYVAGGIKSLPAWILNC